MVAITAYAGAGGNLRTGTPPAFERADASEPTIRGAGPGAGGDSPAGAGEDRHKAGSHHVAKIWPSTRVIRNGRNPETITLPVKIDQGRRGISGCRVGRQSGGCNCYNRRDHDN